MIIKAIEKFDSAVTDGIVRKYENPFALRLAAAVTHLGDAVIHAPLFMALFIFGADTMRRFVICTLAATTLGVIVLYAVRLTVKRRRPIGEMPKEFAIIPKMEEYSFPSGHAMRNSIFPVILYSYFGALPALAVSAPILAAVLSRVYLRLHYFSDIVAGGILGVASAFVALRFF